MGGCCNIYWEQEEVFSCYRVAQEVEKEEKCSQLRAAADVYDNSSVTSAVSTKRKRLTFHECDPNYGIPNEKRPR